MVVLDLDEGGGVAVVGFGVVGVVLEGSLAVLDHLPVVLFITEQLLSLRLIIALLLCNLALVSAFLHFKLIPSVYFL